MRRFAASLAHAGHSLGRELRHHLWLDARAFRPIYRALPAHDDSRRPTQPKRIVKEHAARFALGAMALGAALALAPGALAAYTVHSPTVTAGKNEIGMKGFDSWGTSPNSGTLSEMKITFERGISDFWSSEIELIGKEKYGHSFQANAVEWENKFQLLPKDKYGVNLGLFTSLEYGRGGGWEAEAGPTLDKSFGRIYTRVNLLFSHEYGNAADSGVGLEYRLRVEYRWKPDFSPLIEAYGQPVGRLGAWGEPRNLLGPGFKGEIHFADRQTLEYGLVVLFGASDAAADTTLVARLEYSFF